jgi:hypothetical protein
MCAHRRALALRGQKVELTWRLLALYAQLAPPKHLEKQKGEEVRRQLVEVFLELVHKREAKTDQINAIQVLLQKAENEHPTPETLQRFNIFAETAQRSPTKFVHLPSSTANFL